MGVTLSDVLRWKEYSLFFWKLVLRDVLHGAGRGMFSDGGVTTFVSRLQNAKEVEVVVKETEDDGMKQKKMQVIVKE
eukprot:9784312-Ditylum_brightwellii.AAC.1